MATQYTSILKLALPVQGELSGTWGDVVNDNITSMVEEAIAGRAVINTWTANSHTLTTADGTTSESRAAILTLTDTGTALTGAGTVICPAASKIYIVENGTGQTITVKTSSGTGVAVPNTKNMVVFCDGTNVEEGITNINSLTLNGDGATVSSIKDEDNMASDSATALATQQSIKAYVDSQVGSFDTLAEVLAQGNTTGGTDIAVGTGDDITFADNSKTIFGAGSDLSVYSDGTDGLITSTGHLTLDVTGIIKLDADNAGTVYFQDAGTIYGVVEKSSSNMVIRSGESDGDILFKGNDGGSTVTALTLDMSAAGIATFNSGINIGNRGSASDPTLQSAIDPDTGVFWGGSDILGFSSGGAERLRVSSEVVVNDPSNDVDFRVESDSNTHALFVDAGNDRVGIGQSSPTYKLDVSTSTTGDGIRVFSAGGTPPSIDIGSTRGASADVVLAEINGQWDGGEVASIKFESGDDTTNKDDGRISFYTAVASNSVAERMRIEMDGSIGVGTDSPSTIMHIKSSNPAFLLQDSSQTGRQTQLTQASGVAKVRSRNNASNGQIVFEGYTSSDSTEYARFDGNGTFLTKFGATFNEDSADVDFRVESNGNTHMLFVDAGNDHVNIGTASDLGGLLNVNGSIFAKTTSAGTAVKVESSEAGASAGPGLVLYRSSASPADSDLLGNLTFEAKNDATQDVVYSQIFAQIADASDGTEDGILNFRTILAGTEVRRIDLGATETVFNEDSKDLDFRVESDANANMLFVDGGNDRVGVGMSAPLEPLHTTGRILSTTTYGGSTQRIGTSIGQNGSTRADIDFRRWTGASTNHGVGMIDVADTGIMRFYVDSKTSNTPATTERISLAPSGAFTTTPTTAGHAVFNEGGIDADFRVESNGNANMLFVEGGTDRVGVGTNDPQEMLYMRSSGADARLGIDAPTGYDAEIKFSNNTTVEYTIGHDDATDLFVIGTTNVDTPAVTVNKSGFAGFGGNTNPLVNIHSKSTSTGEQLRLESTDSGGAYGPIMGLHRNSSSPADNDGLGQINFYGEDSAGNLTTYVAFSAIAADVSNGTEDGRLIISTITAGVDISRIDMLTGGTVFNQDSQDMDFVVESNAYTHMLVVDAGLNKVGINKSAPDALFEAQETSGTVFDATDTSGQVGSGATLSVQNLSDDTNAFSQLLLRTRNTSKSVSRIASLVNGTGTDLVFVNEAQGSAPSERMRIRKQGEVIIPGGVTLGTSANVHNDANTLDDYEEGTWTPVVRGSSSNPTVSYAFAQGTYTKVGNVVTVSCYIALASISGGSGNTHIGGLPFNQTTTNNAHLGNSALLIDGLGGDGKQVSLQGGSTDELVIIIGGGGTAVHSGMAPTSLGNTSAIRFIRTYFV